jgi:hypothetical protein
MTEDSFVFLLYVNSDSIARIGRAGFEGGTLTEGYSFLDPVHVAHESPKQYSRRVGIELQIEEALCRQATDKPCPF